MLKVTDYPKAAYDGYFELVHVDDQWTAAGLDVPVGTYIARVYPKAAPCVEHKCTKQGEAEVWVKGQMEQLKKVAA